MIDVLIIGGRNAALCAALMAREGGASVVMLEASPNRQACSDISSVSHRAKAKHRSIVIDNIILLNQYTGYYDKRRMS